MSSNISPSSSPRIQEIQTCILGILKAIDQVCRQRHLRYYLLAGTMLGAVRHKGFVPWDDDADVALPRKDYEILLKHADEWLPENYELVSYHKNPEYPYQFARIQDIRTTYVLRRRFNFVGGIPVDVFPLDGMTENSLKQRLHFWRYNFWNKVKYFTLIDPYKHGKGLRSFFVNMMHNLFSPKELHEKLTKIQSAYDFDASPLVADHDNNIERALLPKEVYGVPTPIEFAGETFMGVQDPDTYLTYCYGNYMELPQKQPPLNFRHLDLNKPYKEYLKEHPEAYPE